MPKGLLQFKPEWVIEDLRDLAVNCTDLCQHNGPEISTERLIECVKYVNQEIEKIPVKDWHSNNDDFWTLHLNKQYMGEALAKRYGLHPWGCQRCFPGAIKPSS